MSPRAIARAAAGILAVAHLLISCGVHHVPAIGSDGAPFEPAADERALWARARSEEDTLLAKVERYDDPRVVEYLGRIAERLVPASVPAAGGPTFTLTVIRDPTLAAFAMPEGRIYVHTGLLSRVENEAQLAIILAREIVHVVDRHALVVMRESGTVEATAGGGSSGSSRALPLASKGKAGASATLSPTARVVLGKGLRLAALGAIDGYGRDLERDADVGGLEAVAAAGYDAVEGSRVFERLQEDAGERGGLEIFLLGNRRSLRDRLATARAHLKSRTRASSSPATASLDDFPVRLREVVRENARLDIRAGRFDLARRQLERVLALTPDDPRAHLYSGDLHRLRSQRARRRGEAETDIRLARERYEKSAALDPTLGDPYRELGFLYYQQKDIARARAAFERYLSLQPDAADAQRIKGYLDDLDRRAPSTSR